MYDIWEYSFLGQTRMWNGWLPCELLGIHKGKHAKHILQYIPESLCKTNVSFQTEYVE